MACLALCLAAACSSKSDVERQRDAAVAAAEREQPKTPTGGLKRSGPLTKADRQAWHPLLAWPASCEETFQATAVSGDAGLAFHQAGAGVTIVEVLCVAGGYQPSHVFIRLDERGSSPVATVLRFPAYEESSGQAVEATQTELAGDSRVDATAHTLAVLTVARQARDCGTWALYNIGAERPRRLAAAMRLPCPDPPGPPVDAVSSEQPAGWSAIAGPH